MPQPLAVITLNHATLELWPTHCRTIFADGKEATAAPTGGDTLIQTVCHELLHSLFAQAIHNAPSACLRAVADGDGRRWTPERRAEEAFAYGGSKALAEAVRQMARAYGATASLTLKDEHEVLRLSPR